MRQPQDAAAVLGDLDRHALADAAEPVERVMRELRKFQITVSLDVPVDVPWAMFLPFGYGVLLR